MLVIFDNLVTKFSAGMEDRILIAVRTWSEMDPAHVFSDKLVAISIHLKDQGKFKTRQ